MPESFWPRLDGFSCRLFVVTAMFCIFAAIFMMPLLPRDLSGQMAMIKWKIFGCPRRLAFKENKHHPTPLGGPTFHGRSSWTQVTWFAGARIHSWLANIICSSDIRDFDLNDVLENQQLMAALTVVRETMRNLQHLRFQPQLAKNLALVQLIRAVHLRLWRCDQLPVPFLNFRVMGPALPS